MTDSPVTPRSSLSDADLRIALAKFVRRCPAPMLRALASVAGLARRPEGGADA